MGETSEFIEKDTQPALIETEMNGILTLEEFDEEKSLERLRAIGTEMAVEYLSQIQKFGKIPIVIVTNGGLIPTLFLVEALNRMQPDFTPPIITLCKNPHVKGNYSSSKLITAKMQRVLQNDFRVFIPEDIVDQKHTLMTLSGMWREVHYYPISKKVSTDYPTELMVPSGVILPDLWVLSNFGMNSDHFPSKYALRLGLSLEYCAKIASLERTAGKFFVPAEGVTRENIVDRHEEYLDLLIKNQLPINSFGVARIEKVQQVLEFMELSKNPIEKALIIQNLFKVLGFRANFQIAV